MTVDELPGDQRGIYAPRALLNSTIFTIGVLLCTLLFGLLAGYALP